MVSQGSAAGIGAFAILVLVLLPFLRLFRAMRKEEEQAAGGSPRRGDEEEAAGGELQLPAAPEQGRRWCARTGRPTGVGRARAGCACRSWPTASSSGFCRRACTTSTPAASRSGSRRTPPALSAVLRSPPPTEICDVGISSHELMMITVISFLFSTIYLT